MTAQSTFGRDGAMFDGLLGFVAQLSVGLWGLVILTVIMRFVGMWIYRHAAARKAAVQTEATPSTEIPAAVAVTDKVPAGARRNQRVERVTAAHVPARAERMAAAQVPAHTTDSV
ncbi:hypothetical protein [Cryobacterium sp.]|uniref:hypothetical protein n=1 Tax=Cryobacterium sp. TaxID=1926290 RepID=UPI00260F2E93|nr:hypothetical protein [Cryobacterium sp.]